MLRILSALAIGGLGGLIGVTIGLPLPWMLGAMILVTLAATLGAPLAPPLQLRKVFIPVLGVMIGSGFRPDMLDQANEWLWSLVVLPVYVFVTFGAAMAFYRIVGKFDSVTAYFAAAPGGLNDMMLLGAEAGGDERRIGLAHASRILVVVSVVSLYYGYFLGIRTTGAGRPYIEFASVPATGIAILLACAIIGAWLGPKLRLPAPQILGPMILSAGVHFFGVTDALPPTLAVNAAQLVMGTVVGARFVGVPAREILKDIALAAGATSIMLTIALISAVAVAKLSQIPIAEMLLAFAPGGLPEMSILSVALGADVAFVGTMHLARISIVIAVAPLVFRQFFRSP